MIDGTGSPDRARPVESTRQPFRARWRPALRLARRDIRRAPGRSALVVALVALPVFALSGADVLARTFQLSPVERMTRQLAGTDALLTFQNTRVEQTPDGESYNGVQGGDVSRTTPSTATVSAALPSGSTVLPDTRSVWSLRSRYGIASATVSDLDVSRPATSGFVRVDSGRLATAPDELTLTPALARSIGLGVGDTLQSVSPDRTFTVVGIVAERWTPDADLARTAPGALTTLTPSDQRANLMHSWYALVPGGLSWSTVVRLNRSGFVAVSRAVTLDPPARTAVPYFQHNTGSSNTVQTVSALGLIGGMILLEIVLLAGPAFAVGARRSRRALALVAATGGTRGDLRRIVLAGGALLGLLAGLAGVVAGVGVGLALVPLVGHWASRVPGHLDLRPLELLGVAAVSVVTGLLAAWAPARAAARTDVVSALRGRRDRVRPRRWVPVVGVVMVALGAVIGIGGTVVLRRAEIVLAGTVLAELGLIVVTPTLLGLVGRLARFLPVSGRIALRDTSRNRSSAAPAVAAIMAAVTGAVAIAVVVVSFRDHDRRTYQPMLPHGYVYASPERTAAGDQQIAAALRSSVDGRAVAVLKGLDTETAADGSSSTVGLKGQATQCGRNGCASMLPQVLVDDGSDLAVIAGRADPAAVAALRAGRAVAFDPGFLDHGRVGVVSTTSDANGQQKDHTFTTAAVLAHATYPATVLVVPPSVATSWGLATHTEGFLVATARVPSDRQEQAAAAVALRYGLDTPSVERGFTDNYQLGLLILLITSAVVTLGAATIATALSTLDSRADLETLAAVGASPRVRRRLSAARAGVIATTGTVLGVGAGLIAPIGYLLLLGRTDYGLHYRVMLPWSSLLVTVVVVPALAVLGAFTLSRSRLPVERTRSV